MTSNVTSFAGKTKGPVSVDKVLDGAKEMETVVVLGLDKDGAFYAASSTGESHTLVWLAEIFKHKLLSGDF